MEVADKELVENQGKKKRRGVRNTTVAVQAPGPAEMKKKKEKERQIEEEGSLVSVITAKSSSNASRIEVSMFDSSAGNHFTAMDTIYKLCGESDIGEYDGGEIERLSSTITFLSEWRYFNYRPKTVRFMPESGISNGIEAHSDITLSPFSAASVPKCDPEAEKLSPSMVSMDSRKDFVLYVGGLVWALDWCPRPEERINSDAKCEFIAVAAHPPDSTYHKLGELLNGRGMIQIWCLVNCSSGSVDLQAGTTKKKYQKKTVAPKDENTPKRPRGRPRKNPIDKIPTVEGPDREFSQALVQLPENKSDVPLVEAKIMNNPTSHRVPGPVDNTEQKSESNAKENKLKKARGRPRKNSTDKTPAVVGNEGQFAQALLVHPSGESANMRPQNVHKMSASASNKENGKKQKDATSRKNAVDNAPAPMDNEVELTQALVVHQSDDTLSLPLLHTTLPVTQKEKGRKLRKCATDKTLPVVDTEGQFVEALTVRPSDHTSNVLPMDESMLTAPAPQKKKRRQKAVTTRKNIEDEIADAPDSEEPVFQALAVEFPENTSNSFCTEENELNAPAPQGKIGKRRRVPSQKALNADLECTISELRRRSKGKPNVHNEPGHDNKQTQNEGEGSSLAGQTEICLGKEDTVLEDNVTDEGVLNLASTGCKAAKNAVLPRVVMCLGHDGKVAWDVKWRPHNACESVNKHIMGYLAVVLGDGSVEVWEIPSPQIIRCIYASQHGDSTDPRFAKLKPVFRCSKLKYGDTQSLPLTVEWSASPPHNLILAGCHDGMVALWKFSADGSSQDARPLLCFRAEMDPIRALSWAPSEGDPDSANVIVTAGHGGLKFWDLRDPFRPLWDANPSQRFIFGLDWLPDPRCILVSYDDGTLRMVSLSRAAYDVPVIGEPFGGTQQRGVHSYCCSSFAIWSIHVSRLTGMVAYCCADGTVLYFQLTHKAVDRDPLRNRAPHFLCGSLVDEESAVAINTHLPNSPHLMKKSATEWANTPSPARSANLAKRVRKGTEKNRKSDGDVLAALSCGDNRTKGDANESQTSSASGKDKAGKTRKASSDQELICIDKNGGSMNGKSDVKEVDGEYELLPSKIVSMYKVRWNMNKGSERWLCYGGAAGIVRCQEIVAPVFDKKLLRKGPS